MYKTEKEKMQSGLPFDQTDSELISERQKARRLLDELNRPGLLGLHEQQAIVNLLLGEAGKDFAIHPPFYCHYGSNITVGNSFTADFNCTFIDAGKITIGDGVILAAGVTLQTTEYTDGEKVTARPITIGSNVKVACGAIITAGVTIGNGAIISPGSVVTGDIPEKVLAAGNPAGVIRSFD